MGTEISGELAAKAKGAEMSGKMDYKREKEYEYIFAKTGFSILPVGQTSKEPQDSDCLTVYVSMFFVDDNGEHTMFLNGKPVEKGERLTLKQNENGTPTWDQDKDVCGGYECGCNSGLCWTSCVMGWCYATEFQSQSFRYITCKDDYECEPEWRRAGSCTV